VKPFSSFMVCNTATRTHTIPIYLVSLDLFLSSVPSQSPPNTVVRSTSSRTIYVAWGPINQAYVHGILLGYEVRFAKDEGPPLTWETRSLGPDTRKITLRDLWYFSRYKIVVCAKTSKGCGKEYSAISYTWDDGEYV